jgi:arylsulfatase A-like enzyme
MNTAAARAMTLFLGALGASLLGACDGEHEAKRPSIVLISIDSLRPDHLGCYGYGPPTSPKLDAFAAAGARFTQAVSTTSWTLPAHAALFTGLFDSAHGLVENGLALSPEHVTLAETLKAAGYQTAGFYGGPYLHPTYGLGQGFDHYQSCMTQLPDDLADDAVRESSQQSFAPAHRDITSPRTVEEVRKWLATADDRPFFAFVHLWDVHYDYLPHEGILELFDPDYQGTLDAGGYMLNSAIRAKMEPRDLQHVLALYDNEIRFTDVYLGDLLAAFEWKAGARDDLLVVITADHGEEFFEHGNKGHQHSVFDESIKVPLIVRWPGHVAPGRVIDGQVRSIDLYPTLAHAGGAEVPASVQGRDLLPLLTGAASFASEPALLELTVGPIYERALRTETIKVGERSLGGAPKRSFGFQLDRDPGEKQPLAADAPDVERALAGMHELVHRSLELNRSLGGAPTRTTVDPALEERLREAGYLGAGK